MNSRSALGAAGAIGLTVAGGVSALFLTVGGQAGASTETSTIGDEVISVEYVDQYGNPVDAPTADAAVQGSPEVVFVDSNGNPIADPAQAPAADYEAEAGYEESEYEDDDEYEDEKDEEYEEDEEYEDEDYEEDDDDEYEAMGVVGQAGAEHG